MKKTAETRAQIASLEAIERKPLPTTKSARDGYLSGASAAALVRRGLATRIPQDGEFFVRITERGRLVLAAERSRRTAEKKG